MSSPTHITANHDDHVIALFAALAITIHIAEAALPSPLPGIKPGFANIITLYVMLQYGWRTAVWVSLLRVLGASLLLGTFLSPTFILSLSGALASLMVLGLMFHLPRQPFGPVGYACLAALAHMAAQFFSAYFLFMPHPALLALLPILMTSALISGGLGGILTSMTLNRLNNRS